MNQQSKLKQINEWLTAMPADGPGGERSFHPAIEVEGMQIHGATPGLGDDVAAYDFEGNGGLLSSMSQGDRNVIDALYARLSEQRQWTRPASTITHRNGGLEQGLLEAVQQTQGLSAKDAERLKHLQSLPQNRTETLSPNNKTAA